MKTLIKITVSFGALIFIAFSLDWSSVIESMSGVTWWAIPAASLLQVCGFLIGTNRWYTLLRAHGMPCRRMELVRPYFIGAFLNNFLPTSTGGDAFRVYHIHNDKRGAAAAFSPIITERFLGLLTMLLVAQISFLFLDRSSTIIRHAINVIHFAFSVQVILLALIAFPVTYRPLLRFIERFAKFPLYAGFLNVAQAVHESVKRLRLVLKVVVISVFTQSCVIGTFWIIGKGVGVELSPIYFIGIVPLILISASIPITVGGLGVRETVAITLFSSVGMPQEDAAAIAILYIPTLLIAGLPGLYFFLKYRRSPNSKIPRT